MKDLKSSKKTSRCPNSNPQLSALSRPVVTIVCESGDEAPHVAANFILSLARALSPVDRNSLAVGEQDWAGGCLPALFNLNEQARQTAAEAGGAAGYGLV